MGYVFISYSHKDKAYADKLQNALQGRGFNTWIDDRIDFGVSWPKTIENFLDHCAAFIVVMTDRSHGSMWVQNELARAQSKNKPIFPLLLQGEPWLSVQSLQYGDVTNGKIPPEKFFDRLAEVSPSLSKDRSIADQPRKQGSGTTSKSELKDSAFFYRQGILLNKKKDYPAALAYFNLAIKSNPRHARSFNNRGISFYELRDFRAALMDFTQAIHLDPKYANAYFNRGNTYDELHEYDKALQDFTRAIKLDPNFANAYYNRGIVCRRIGNFRQAKMDLARYEQLGSK